MRFPGAASFSLFLLLCSCGGSNQPIAIRLVDHFNQKMVKNVPTQVTRPEPAGIWEFGETPEKPPEESPATVGWKAGAGVSSLRIEDGRLQGRTTTSFPIVHVERKEGLDTSDLLHAVEIRMQASKGANLSAESQGSGDLNVKRILERAQGLSEPWNLNAPLIAGENIETYVLTPPRNTRLSSVHKLLIRPSDEAGAEFEIESVKIVSRREHLSRIPSGVGWQGLGEIYRETVVSRSPESIQVDLDLPQDPWLDLHVGSVEDAAVTFEVRVAEAGSDPTEGELLLQRTVTTTDRWEEAALDLSSHAGRSVTLALDLYAEDAGALGFWGGPAIRDRAAVSPAATERPPVEAVPGSPAPQGVILIVADTLRKDHLNFHGYERETAPFLARLGSEGAIFRDNVAQATWTKVSVPSILTGMYPLAHRVADMRDRLPAAAVTLAEVYREAGYATVSYSSVTFSGKFTNLHQGFEELHERSSIEESGSKTARTYVDRLTDWLEAQKDGPFFVFLHVFDPHSPFEPRRPYNGLWADPAQRDAHDKNVETVKEFIKHPSDRNRVMPMLDELKASGVDRDEFMAYNRGWYDGSILGMDVEMGRLFEKLRAAQPGGEDVDGVHGRSWRRLPRAWIHVARATRVRRTHGRSADVLRPGFRTGRPRLRRDHSQHRHCSDTSGTEPSASPGDDPRAEPRAVDGGSAGLAKRRLSPGGRRGERLGTATGDRAEGRDEAVGRAETLRYRSVCDRLGRLETDSPSEAAGGNRGIRTLPSRGGPT